MRVRDPAVCQPTTAVRPAAPTHLKVPPASLRRVLDRGWSARFDGLQVTGDQHGRTPPLRGWWPTRRPCTAGADVLKERSG
jgi:hypothetical protein